MSADWDDEPILDYIWGISREKLMAHDSEEWVKVNYTVYHAGQARLGDKPKPNTHTAHSHTVTHQQLANQLKQPQIRLQRQRLRLQQLQEQQWQSELPRVGPREPRFRVWGGGVLVWEGPKAKTNQHGGLTDSQGEATVG